MLNGFSDFILKQSAMLSSKLHIFDVCNWYLQENKVSSIFQSENFKATSFVNFFMFRFVRKILILD